ncbi:MAG: response regulator, partial [Candidatus Limnocylindrales bacterium]
MDLVTVTTQVLFVLLFVWAVWMAVRRHDALARDVALVFAPIAVVQATGVLRSWVGPLPFWVSAGTIILLLAQPVFSLKLVSDIRTLPRGLLAVASGAFVITSAWLLATMGEVALAYVAAALVFVLTELVAAAYFAIEARRRTGAARVRLAVAALATAGVALAIFAIGVAIAAPQQVGTAPTVVLQVGALLAAVGYWIAFLPPRALRRFWQGNAAFAHSEQLLAAPPTTRSDELWAQLATTAHQLTGAATVVLLADAVNLRVAASSDPAVQPGTIYPGASLEMVLAVRTDPVADDLLQRTGSRFAKVVPLRPEQTPIGAILLLRPRASLFDSDDTELVGALGVRSAQLVQRREVLAEQESLSIRLTHTVAALEAAGAAKSDFLASMSHELRTPLNAIIGFSALMASQEEVDGTLPVPREWVEHIRSGGDHLLSLINDVLDLSRIEAGRLDLVKERVDLGRAITASVGGMRPLADRKGQHIEISGDPSLAVEVDPGRLRQILYNLLSNAIKYTPEGGRIWVTTEQADGEARIAVRDNGVGIAQDDRDRVFEEFSQVGDTAQRVEGTGLGLSLTRRLVEAHGGRIDLVSELGAGSTFTVVFPEPGGANAGRPTPDGTLGTAGGDHPDYVLVIEDEPSSSRLLQTYLADAGYQVKLATDGERGLAMATAERPGAIVLDVLLPRMDGWEVLRRLKSDPGLRDVPVIIVTVVDERGVGLALGAVDYLVKPIDPDALLARLGRYRFTAKVKTHSMRVIAIDDDPSALEVVAHTLEPLGFAVHQASSGQDGIRLAMQDPPDLVICDLVMPQMDGFEVIALLHDHPSTVDTPILVLTAHDLSAADKARLNGSVLGIAAKGDAGTDGLGAWLK